MIKAFFKSPEFKIAGLILAILIATSYFIIKETSFITNTFSYNELSPNDINSLENVLSYIAYLTITVIGISVAYYVYYITAKIDKNKELVKIIDKSEVPDLKKEISSLKKDLKKFEKPNHIIHKRFEKIVKKRLKYVAIDYKPFFWIKDDAKKETPSGIGYELMNKIFEPFNVELINETPSSGYSWKSIFEDFSGAKRQEIDFIMTPMYETRSRLYDYDVIYSIPLFYSDIGIYVKENTETENLKLSYDDAITFLKSKRDSSEKWEIEFLEGEISEIVGKKSMYEKGDERRKLSEDIAKRYKYRDFSEKLNNVSSEDKTTGDVILMEIFKAQSIIDEENLNIVNILKDNQLVYPVSFVIHKEETVLRNFINLRISELKFNGELQRIIKTNALQIDLTDEKVIDKVFLQNYDFTLIDNNYIKKRSRFSDRMREKFDLLDKFYGNYGSFQKSIKNTIENFRKDEPLNILEIGFGSGLTTEVILEARKNNNDKITVIDDDVFMQEQIRKNKNVNPKKVSIIIIDVIKYLESDDLKPFDMVVSGYTIHNLTKQQREKLYELLYKNMSANSIFINADKIAQDKDEERIEALKYRVNKYIDYLKTNPEKYLLIEEWVSHYIDDQSENIVMKRTETINALADKGFKKENISIETPTDFEEKEMMAILTAKKTE
ncbi:transporter substrate-binding domain-containing protein [Marixanthomonas sp. SCSIO 43207]|uniref:transporter substrate-binding domain-containing protein n=1 Tax=Marixanthomonas sp. SCSIO 43207 TaxID=2779360 RepID=UPI001CA8546D|nr:transporter substrate-binding domain-containing protein [Marixanthomonas sp. SCSIO 43207]UAB80964.1 transporter substrate-binding domain-containing protein [Marixanthomonas sp. SCSIO 43207]